MTVVTTDRLELRNEKRQKLFPLSLDARELPLGRTISGKGYMTLPYWLWRQMDFLFATDCKLMVAHKNIWVYN